MLRAEYLFLLGHLCPGSIPGGDVNRLTVSDFATLIDSADAYLKAMNKK